MRQERSLHNKRHVQEKRRGRNAKYLKICDESCTCTYIFMTLFNYTHDVLSNFFNDFTGLELWTRYSLFFYFNFAAPFALFLIYYILWFDIVYNN